MISGSFGKLFAALLLKSTINNDHKTSSYRHIFDAARSTTIPPPHVLLQIYSRESRARASDAVMPLEWQNTVT
jgi:hypothetical protein